MVSHESARCGCGQQQQSAPQILVGHTRQGNARLAQRPGPLVGSEKLAGRSRLPRQDRNQARTRLLQGGQPVQPRLGEEAAVRVAHARRRVVVLLEEDRRVGRIREAIRADQRVRRRAAEGSHPSQESRQRRALEDGVRHGEQVVRGVRAGDGRQQHLPGRPVSALSGSAIPISAPAAPQPESPVLETMGDAPCRGNSAFGRMAIASSRGYR